MEIISLYRYLTNYMIKVYFQFCVSYNQLYYAICLAVLFYKNVFIEFFLMMIFVDISSLKGKISR